MSVGTVRWGVLGAAKIAREFVLPAIHMSRGGAFTAIASRSSERADSLCGPYGDVTVHGRYEALLADADVDAVYIPLANGQHVEWTARTLGAGKAVLCEKPIALRAAEIDQLIALRDETRLLAAEAFMVVHHPQWHRVRALIASETIGRLRHIDGAFSFFNDDPTNIRNMAELGGGALRDIGVYPVVTARFATGREPEHVRAEIEWDRGIDSFARVWCDFGDLRLDFYVSMRLGQRQEMVFHGEEGWLRVATPFNAGLYGEDILELRDASGNYRIERFPWVDQYRLQIEAFNRSLLEGVDFPCTLEFSRGNQAVIDAIYASGAANGERVAVNP